MVGARGSVAPGVRGSMAAAAPLDGLPTPLAAAESAVAAAIAAGSAGVDLESIIKHKDHEAKKMLAHKELQFQEHLRAKMEEQEDRRKEMAEKMERDFKEKYGSNRKEFEMELEKALAEKDARHRSILEHKDAENRQAVETAVKLAKEQMEKQVKMELKKQQGEFFQQQLAFQQDQDERELEQARMLAEARSEAAREAKVKMEKKMQDERETYEKQIAQIQEGIDGRFQSLLAEKEREFEEAKSRAIEAVVEDAENRFMKAMEDVEERMLEADAMKDRAVDEARRAEEKRFKLILAGKLEEQEKENKDAAEAMIEREESACRLKQDNKKRDREHQKQMEERIEKAVQETRAAEEARWTALMKEMKTDLEEEQSEAVEAAVKEQRRIAEVVESQALRAQEERIQLILEEQAELRDLAVKEGKAEEKLIYARKVQEMVQEHEEEIRELEEEHTKKIKAMQMTSSQDLVRARREQEREEEEQEREMEKLRDELQEAEEFAVYTQEKCSVLWHARKIERKCHKFLIGLHQLVKHKERASRWGERQRREERQLYMHQVFQAFIENMRIRADERRKQETEDALFHVQNHVVALWGDREALIVMRKCFHVLLDLKEEDQTGKRAYKVQKQQTLEIVERMQNMTAEARLVAEKARVSQDAVLQRVVNFVKTNRASRRNSA